MQNFTFLNLVVRIVTVLPCSGIRGTYKREQSYLFLYKCQSEQNIL